MSMAQARPLTKPVSARAAASKPNAALAEHILISSDEAADPNAAQTVRERWRLGNPLRRQSTEITVFEEGYVGDQAARGPYQRCAIPPRPALSRSDSVDHSGDRDTRLVDSRRLHCRRARRVRAGVFHVPRCARRLVRSRRGGRGVGSNRDRAASQPRDDRVLHAPWPRARTRARRELRGDQAVPRIRARAQPRDRGGGGGDHRATPRRSCAPRCASTIASAATAY